IWVRIGQQHPEARVAEATVRRYVQRRNEELGLAARFQPSRSLRGRDGRVRTVASARRLARPDSAGRSPDRLVILPLFRFNMGLGGTHSPRVGRAEPALSRSLAPLASGEGRPLDRRHHDSVRIRSGSRAEILEAFPDANSGPLFARDPLGAALRVPHTAGLIPVVSSRGDSLHADIGHSPHPANCAVAPVLHPGAGPSRRDQLRITRSKPLANGTDLMEWTHPGSWNERAVAMLVSGPRRDIHDHYNGRPRYRQARCSN